MSEDPYRPLACGLHDELEARAVRRAVCELRYRDGGEVRAVRGRIVDIEVRGGEEHLRMDDGTRIRLDRLVEVDGVAFGAGCENGA